MAQSGIDIFATGYTGSDGLLQSMIEGALKFLLASQNLYAQGYPPTFSSSIEDLGSYVLLVHSSLVNARVTGNGELYLSESAQRQLSYWLTEEIPYFVIITLVSGDERGQHLEELLYAALVSGSSKLTLGVDEYTSDSESSIGELLEETVVNSYMYMSAFLLDEYVGRFTREEYDRDIQLLLRNKNHRGKIFIYDALLYIISRVRNSGNSNGSGGYKSQTFVELVQQEISRGHAGTLRIPTLLIQLFSLASLGTSLQSIAGVIDNKMLQGMEYLEGLLRRNKR